MAFSSRLGLVDYSLAALLRLGGDTAFIDLEDVAVEAHRLAPDRFRWRRHDFPNLDLVRITLSDANKGSARMVLYDRSGRKLTVDGIHRAELALRTIDDGTATREDDTLRRQSLSEIARMESHPAYERWQQGGMAAVDAVDLADLVRCAISTPIILFRDRLRGSQSEAAHWHRDSLARFLGEAADDLPRLIAEEHL
jgi:hypothetical protein